MSVIEFPGLWNFKITVNRVAFIVLGIPIYWYGILISFAFLLAVFLAFKQSKKYGIEPDNILDLVIYIAPAGIIGSRLYYVIFSWDEFKDNLIQILDTRKGGLAIYGGIIAGLIAAFIFAKVKKLNFLHLFDFGITYVPMAQAIGRWGNFINQEAYGTNTSLPWGMTSDTIRNELAASTSKLSQMGIYVDPAKPVHPTFLYESLWDLGVFLFLLWYRKRKKVNGEVFFLYMVLYGIGRACIESLRTDSLMLGNHRISQAIAIVFAIAFTILIFVMRKYRYSKEESEVYELGSSSYGAILKELKREEEEESAETRSETKAGEATAEGVEEEAPEGAGEETGEKAAVEAGKPEETVVEGAGEKAAERAGEESGEGAIGGTGKKAGDEVEEGTGEEAGEKAGDALDGKPDGEKTEGEKETSES